MLESKFKTQLKKDIEARLPGCMVLHGDPSLHGQGFPDLLVLHNNRWAALEGKQTTTSRKRPNQEYYVEKLNDMSYAAFVCPENQMEVLHALQQALSLP